MVVAVAMCGCQAEVVARIGSVIVSLVCVFFFQAEDGIRDSSVTGVQTCALPIYACDAFPVLLLGDFGQQVRDFTPQIGGYALQPADRNRLAIQAATPAGGLARPVAGGSQDRREHVGVPGEPVSVGGTALRYPSGITRKVCVGRTGPMA